MLASSTDDLFLSEARLDNFNEISSSATNPLNDVMRVELKGRIELRARVVDPIVIDVVAEITCFDVSNVGRRFRHGQLECFIQNWKDVVGS